MVAIDLPPSLSSSNPIRYVKSGPSVRAVGKVSKPRNVDAAASRGDRWFPGKPGKSQLVIVAGIEACSKTRVLSTTVPLEIQGDTSTAGTRTPRRSKLKGWPVPVSVAGAVKPSGRHAGGAT